MIYMIQNLCYPHSDGRSVKYCSYLLYSLYLTEIKEDYIDQKQLQMINRKIELYLQPQSLELKFEKSLKFQIAIFRMSKEESKDGKRPFKIDKTDPVKYTNPNQKITFNKTLALMTTLVYSPQSKKYQDKDIDFQLALDVDGKKDRIAKKVNLGEIAQLKSKNQKWSHDTAMIVFNCRIYVKFTEHEQENINLEVKDSKKSLKKASLRVDGTDKDFLRSQKGRGKTIFMESPQGEAPDPLTPQKSQRNEKETIAMKKGKSSNKLNVIAQKCASQKEQSFLSNSNSSYVLSKSSWKTQKSQQLLDQQNRQINKKLKQKDIKISELKAQIETISQKYSQLQVKAHSEQKIHKKQKQQYKHQIKSHEHAIISLKQEIKTNKEQLKKYKSQLQFYTSNSTQQPLSNQESQIRQLKQLNSILTKNNDDYYKQLMQLQNEIRHKDRQMGEYKTKIYDLDNQNLVLLEQHKSLEMKYNKVKNQSNEQMAEISHKLQSLKEENKSLKIIPSSRDVKDDHQLKKKCQVLEKQVQKKEQLIKKMMQMKKQLQTQKNHEISTLKKQINTLLQQIHKLQTNHNGQKHFSLDIETKLQMEKMKKQLQTLRKNQKIILMQKCKLEASNRAFQDDLIKSKNVLANIINVVQQTQSEKLITDIFNLLV